MTRTHMRNAGTIHLLVEMLREEWRIHAVRFRSRHFVFFPLLIALFACATVGLLVATGTESRTVFAGIHVLAFVFGLHTGSVGLIGQDSLRNLLDDLTLLIFSARTLPLSQRRLVGIFVVKDVLYYAGLFLVPIALGTTVAIAGVAGSFGIGSFAGTLSLVTITLTGMFLLGIGATLAIVGIIDRRVVGLPVLGIVIALVGGAWLTDLPVTSVTPYGVFLAPTIPRVAGSIVLIAFVVLLGALTFDIHARRPARSVPAAFRRWIAWIGDPVATKTLLDVHRSSGGFAKVGFSAVVLLAVTIALVEFAGRITGVGSSAGISFGTILGLTGFTTYNWLTQFDDIESYRSLPVDVAALFRAKFRSFVALGPGIGLATFAIALGWYRGPLLEGLVGGVILVGVACYIFGVTVYLAGVSPNEFLFDTRLFATFCLAMIVPLTPILVVAFAMSPIPTHLLGLLGVAGIGLVFSGVLLYDRSIPKWERRYRC